MIWITAWDSPTLYLVSRETGDIIMAVKPINLIHAKDPAWIIALWIAIHGGDPAPDQRGQIAGAVVAKGAADLIRAVAANLEPAQAKAVVAALG